MIAQRVQRWYHVGLASRWAMVAALIGMAWYIVFSLALLPAIQALYSSYPLTPPADVPFPLTHFGDARQYVWFCIQGDIGLDTALLPTSKNSRFNWMPVYATLQCGLHTVGVSMVYAGWVVSILAIGLSVLLAASVLDHLSVPRGYLYALVLLMPAIGGGWLYLAGAEATYLTVGMAMLWLVTLPSASTPAGEISRAAGGVLLGVIFILTKPNALGVVPALLFAFLYQSWQRSRQVGYDYNLWVFTADVLIEHLRPLFAGLSLLTQRRFELERRPIEYEWSSLAVIAGVGLGLAIWLWYSSYLSGVAWYFLKQQASPWLWPRAWAPGDIKSMVIYFLQAFHGRSADGTMPPWRYYAGWNLAAYLSVLVPAASPRVPGLIRGMLPLLIVFLLFSGTVASSDRYMASTALVAIGWACWVAPTKPGSKWYIVRILFVMALFIITAALLFGVMLPYGKPDDWGIMDG